jgi:hypothetical protein
LGIQRIEIIPHRVYNIAIEQGNTSSPKRKENKKMTVDAIVKEIEKRIKFLDKKYNDYYWEMIVCRTADDTEGEDKAIEERRKISYEKSKLEDMLRVYKK